MKKKLTLLVLVILITLVTATTALADHEKQSFTIGGTITAIGEDTITVQTRNGSVTVQVQDETDYSRRISDGDFEVIGFDDLVLYESTNIKYTVSDDGEYFATKVKVNVPLICNP